MSLQLLLDKYFSKIEPARSPEWKKKIMRIVQKKIKGGKVENEAEIKRLISSAHEQEDENLFLNAAKNAVLRDKILKSDKNNIDEHIKDIRQELQLRFINYYRLEKGNEEQFLNGIISKNVVSDYKRENKPFIEEDIYPSIEDQNLIKSVKRPFFQRLSENNFENDKFSEEMKLFFDDDETNNYLTELAVAIEDDRRAQDWFDSVYKFLIITQPDLLSRRKLPDLKHIYPSKEFISKQYEFLKEIDDETVSVAGYLQQYAIVNADERYFMLKSIDVLKKCREVFETQLLPELISLGNKEEEIRKRIPLLSAVAVDKNGKLISTAFKGEKGRIYDHCEYTLFTDILTQNDKHQLEGGTLYVTLEPCNKRAFYIDNDGNEIPKIPCAVLCVMSGISNIYIGTYDPNKKVEWLGIEILKSGKYSFQKRGGKIFGTDDKETISSNLLKKEFDKRGFIVVEDTETEMKYQIGNPVNVKFFHPDLSLEIMSLNKEFIGDKSELAFPLSRLLK